jgi:hypothetical protein
MIYVNWTRESRTRFCGTQLSVYAKGRQTKLDSRLDDEEVIEPVLICCRDV